ncbi:MAG: hypothetical protein E4H40_02340 [Candidatus Brocadiia bacterium]|nr:MAG: hypothetical protein E4H40_02340 [Candidatus Brocadiia bacterium]
MDIAAPRLTIEDPENNDKLPLKLLLKDYSAMSEKAVVKYEISLEWKGHRIDGRYDITVQPAATQPEDVLLYTSELAFEEPIQHDLLVQQGFDIPKALVERMILPERDGFLRSYPLKAFGSGAGRFELGKKAATGAPCSELGIPVIGLALADRADRAKNLQFSVCMDPYCGGRIDASYGTVTVSTTYMGSAVPLVAEKRTIAMAIHSQDADQMLTSFYHTVPHIRPGAAWIHDVHLLYYDYLSDDGQGWYKGLEYLADRINLKHRGRVAVCLHGWYDYFQQYAYDHEKGKLIDEWTAFPGTRKIPMSIKSMHDRLQFARKLGFRVLLYFSDGTNSDTGAPGFRPDFVLKDSSGKTSKGWKGPDSLGDAVKMDPSVPGLRDWYRGYLRALLDEYARDIDGLVWDETFYIRSGTVSYTGKTPTYADRAMMSLVSELTQIVQEYHRVNDQLVFLVSDGSQTSYALVAHGTWQDTACDPQDWGPGMFRNYRNCLWSCLWYPISKADRNRIAAEQYGLPQCLSNGWEDDQGPHEMPAEILEDVLRRFTRNVEAKRHRMKYLSP